MAAGAGAPGDTMLPAVTPEALALAAGAILVLYGALSREARRVILRTVAVAVPAGLLLAAAILATLPLAATAGDPTRLWQAGIAGGIIAFGWVFTFAIGELRSEQARRAREKEMLVAIREEILDALGDIQRDDLRQMSADLEESILTGEGGGPYHPFTTTAKQMTVFEALSSDSALLPRRPLPAIIAYQAQARDVLTLSRDLQRDEFRSLPAARRARLYRHFMSMRIEAEDLAIDAVRAINRELPFDRVAVPHKRPPPQQTQRQGE
jgi:hypothetical protein